MIWPVKKLGDILSTAEIFTDGDWVESKDQDVNGSIRLLQLADIGDGNFINKSNRFINESTFIRLKCTEVQLGDILIARMPDPLGRACIFEGISQKCITVVDVCIIRVDSNIVDARWLMHAINNDSVRRQISSFAKGATRVRISRKNLSHIQIEFPPLAEQQRIAELLDTADRILKQRESAIAKLDQLAQSVFVAMFSNIEHITTLSQVAELKRGPFGGALKKEIFVKHGPMVYEQRNAIYDDCKNGKYFITEEKFNEMKDFSVTDNDLIVSCSGTLGKVAKIDKESPRGIINQALLRVRPKKNISSSFLKSAIESVSVQRNLAISSHGSGLQNFPPMAVVKAVPIPLPSFELQLKFESIKEEILKKKIDLINSKNNLENLLKSLQHQSFAVN